MSVRLASATRDSQLDWLKRVLNEAVKSNTTAREEEVRRFPDGYIDSIKSPDVHVPRSIREMRDAFRTHFCDRFAYRTDLLPLEFRCYLVDFRAKEAASCEDVVTECEVCNALNQVDHNKLPGLDGLLNPSVFGICFEDCRIQTGVPQMD